MKIYADQKQIISLENVAHIWAATDTTLRIKYNDNSENYIRFDDPKKLQEGLEKISLILQEKNEDILIIFEDLQFRKSNLVYTRLSINSIHFAFGGRGGSLVETSVCYRSERAAKEKYQELLKKLK